MGTPRKYNGILEVSWKHQESPMGTPKSHGLLSWESHMETPREHNGELRSPTEVPRKCHIIFIEVLGQSHRNITEARWEVPSPTQVPWCSHGVPMRPSSSRFRGVPMGLAWDSQRTSVVLPWCFRGVRMGLPSVFHGNLDLRGTSWDFDGTSTSETEEFPWCFRGVAHGTSGMDPWDLNETSMRFMLP